jgi:hypothetical protein
MTMMFGVLGASIRDHHFSTHHDVEAAASDRFDEVSVQQLHALGGMLGPVYEVGSFRRNG